MKDEAEFPRDAWALQDMQAKETAYARAWENVAGARDPRQLDMAEGMRCGGESLELTWVHGLSW